MESHYAAKLLRLAVKDPERLTTEKKFWKPALFPYYLRRCDDLLWDTPAEGLVFTQAAPFLAARIAEAHPTKTNAADPMVLGYSYLGGAYRRLGDYPSSEALFKEASAYREQTSPKPLAEYLRRYAYLCIVLRRPEAFEAINEAIAIHKRGNLVHRHELGECLLCRGSAYLHFDQPNRVFRDVTAALHHLSMRVDRKPYYCAIHNLANWAVKYGTEEELKMALDNLRSAKRLLSIYSQRHYARYGLQWLIALLDSRLGRYAAAEQSLTLAGEGFRKLELPFEVGLVQLDLAQVYLAQRRRQELIRLVKKTARHFRGMGNQANAARALKLWREIFREKVTATWLAEARERFFRHKAPIPAGIAA